MPLDTALIRKLKLQQPQFSAWNILRNLTGNGTGLRLDVSHGDEEYLAAYTGKQDNNQPAFGGNVDSQHFRRPHRMVLPEHSAEAVTVSVHTDRARL